MRELNIKLRVINLLNEHTGKVFSDTGIIKNFGGKKDIDGTGNYLRTSKIVWN